MNAVESFESLRPTLFSLAYRMLGSVSEAEDVVREAFPRQQHALSEGAEIESPKAFLSAVVTRLSIDRKHRVPLLTCKKLPVCGYTERRAGADPLVLAVGSPQRR